MGQKGGINFSYEIEGFMWWDFHDIFFNEAMISFVFIFSLLFYHL